MKKVVKNNILNKECGITLVALVVTIIILLILAGVTLNIALSENGIFEKAKEAVEKYKDSSETEALGMSVMKYTISRDEKDKIGEILKDNSVDNPDWTVIKLKNENKQYGTNYTYVKEGTEIEGYGKAKHNWVINYETGEIIQLDDYIKVSSGEGVAVTDNLELNINPKSMSNLDALGSGITFISGSGEASKEEYLKGSYIEFDGVDDYLKIDNVHIDDNGGFTFEIFGKRIEKNKEIILLSKTKFEGKQIELQNTNFRNAINLNNFYSCCMGNHKARRFISKTKRDSRTLDRLQN